MDPTIAQLFDSKTFLSLASAAFGGLVTAFVAIARGRIRFLDYTVQHSRVAAAGEDKVFGTVEVTWQGSKVPYLFLSRVEIRNDTGKDLTGLSLKVLAGQGTLLLNEKTEVVGTSYILHHTKDYSDFVRVAEGQAPSDRQQDAYYTRREYSVQTLNRDGRLVLEFLTTVKMGAPSPTVWVDTLHAGLKLRLNAPAPRLFNVPLQYALVLGLFASLITLLVVGTLVESTWLAAGICMVVGLFANGVGVVVYKGYQFILKHLLR